MKKFPYWHQTSQASCGPSCLLMIFNYYNPSYGLSRKKEWEIWRDVSLLAWPGSHPYGLAVGALKRGFKITLIREKREIWRDPIFPKKNESLRYVIKDQEKEAKRLGLVEKINKKIDLQFLKSLLEKNIHPIVFMRFIRKNGRLGLSHYVVLIKIENDYVVINDPYVSANRKIPIRLFMKGFRKIRTPRWRMGKEVLMIEK